LGGAGARAHHPPLVFFRGLETPGRPRLGLHLVLALLSTVSGQERGCSPEDVMPRHKQLGQMRSVGAATCTFWRMVTLVTWFPLAASFGSRLPAKALDASPGALLLQGIRTQKQWADERCGCPQLLVDTDGGGDDAFMLMWLISLCEAGNRCTIQAVTCSDGNVPAAQCVKNVRHIFALFPDARVPPIGATAPKGGGGDGGAAHIHGNDGLGGLSARMKLAADDGTRDAAELIVDTLLQNPLLVKVVSTGPLTNLAEAEVRQPGILLLAAAVIWMGGSDKAGGNITPLAEFNSWSDPAAAKAVLAVRNDTVVLPLDVTTQLVMTREHVLKLVKDNRGSRDVIDSTHSDACWAERNYTSDGDGRRDFMVDLAAFMWNSNMRYRAVGDKIGFLVHDASVILHLFYPATLRFYYTYLHISTEDATRGFTYSDTRVVPHEPFGNAWVAVDVDHVRGIATMIEDLKLVVPRVPCHEKSVAS